MSSKIKAKRRSCPVRVSWSDYGISRERYEQLRDYCRNPDNASVVTQEAHRANETIWRNIYISVTKNRTYEAVEWLGGHRIPCGRSDFYGYRRRFFAFLDERLGQEEKERST